MQSTSTLRVSPDGNLSSAYSPSLATNCACAPADRAICAPLPGFNSTLWTGAGPSVMTDRNVAALALSGGRLWIGYFDRGLDVVDASLEHAVHRESEVLFCINRIVADTEHARTAVATANGLVLFDSSAQPRQIMGRKDG